MPRVNDAVLGKPTPPKVLQAIQTISKYLKLGGWVQCIISAEGGAAFRLTDIHDDLMEMIDAGFRRELEPKPQPKIKPFTFDERSRITEDEAKELAETADLTLPKIPLCTCGYGGGPSPAHRGDCPMRIWE